MDGGVDTFDPIETNDFGLRAGSFVVAPIPFQNPTIGTGLALGAGYLFQNDASAGTSLIGLGVAGSDNGTRVYGLLANINTAENRWRIKSFFGRADVNYDLFVGPVSVPLNQEGIVARSSLSYGLTPQLAAGA